MDPSKLPRFSRTEKPATEASPPSSPAMTPPVPSFAAEAWISIAVGLILLFFLPHAPKLWSYTFDREGFESTYSFRDRGGEPITYPESAFFWEDIGATAFSLSLIVLGVALIFVRRALLMGVIGLLGAMTLLNLFVLIHVRPEIGFRILPALAVAFGIYLIIRQWQLMQLLRPVST